MRLWTAYSIRFVLLLICFGVGRAEAPSPLSICDLLSRLDEFNGKAITVQGELVGTMHATLLKAEHSCQKPLKTLGFTWPNAISFQEAPGSNLQSLARFQLEVEGRSKSGTAATEKIVAIAEGRLEARTEEVVARPSGDGYFVNGLGPNSSYAAQLDFTSLRLLEIRQRPPGKTR